MSFNISGSFVDNSTPMSGNVDATLNLGIQGPPGPQGASGGYYVPAIEQTGENELEVSFSPSLPDMPAVDPVQVELPHSGGNVDSNGCFVAQDIPPEDTSVLWIDTDDDSDDGFQEAVNTVLAQAKASGEFDGAPGQPGKDGKDYVLTPDDKNEIAELASELVEVPEPSGGGIAVTGAKVGQTVKIAEVDENGVPTAWEPMDVSYTKPEIDAIMGSYITDIDTLVGGDG